MQTIGLEQMTEMYRLFWPWVFLQSPTKIKHRLAKERAKRITGRIKLYAERVQKDGYYEEYLDKQEFEYIDNFFTPKGFIVTVDGPWEVSNPLLQENLKRFVKVSV